MIMKEQDNQKKTEVGPKPGGSETTHLYGLRRKKTRKTQVKEKMPSVSRSKNSSSGEYKPGSIQKLHIKKEDISDGNSKEKKKKKSRKRKSKHSHHKHPAKKKVAIVSEDVHEPATESEDIQLDATESEDIHQNVTINNGDHESIKRNPGVVFMNIKEEVIDPEYERVLLYVDAEDDPSGHVSFQEEEEEEDEYFPQTDEDEGSESAVDGGLRFSDIGDGMPLIMEVKQEVEDQGYAVINEWDEVAISDLQTDGNSTSKEEEELCSMAPIDIKKENDLYYNCYEEYPLKISKNPNLEKFYLHKLNFWVFHCPLCSSQQVFLHKCWLQQHLEEPFHKEKGKISREAQKLLQDLLLVKDKEQFCPVETCQVAVKGGVEEFCKHLLSEHIEIFLYIRKLCQINVFCQETETDSETKYSLTVQVNGKWHTFYRTKASSEIQTLIKEDSVEFFPVAKIVDVPKMKMTVRVNKHPVIIKPSSPFIPQAAPRDSSSFCFDDITYYKCPICPSLTVFFDVISLKTHMIKKSHQLSSVCRVLKEIGVQHPTYTCPVVNCNADFSLSQKKQLKHIMTEHPDKYDILKRLMDGCYQNFQSIAGIEGCIGGLQGLGIPQPQTINVTFRTGAKPLPTLKPKPPASTSPYQNQIILSQPQQQSTLVGSLPPTAGPAVFTSIQSPVVPKSALRMFPSSQTVRQILDSKMVSKKMVLDSGGGSPQSGEMDISRNGITTLAWSDSGSNVNDQQTSLRIHSATGLNKPRPLCYKCGVNALSNIGLISHLFSEHCNLICKICSFSAEPLQISNSIVNHMKDKHNIDPCELEMNICQSLQDISQVIGVSQLDGLSCITQKKFILDELVVHYTLVDASFHQDKFQDDLIVRQVKKEDDEVWIEILVGEKHLEDSGRLLVNCEDVASAGANSRNLVTGLKMNKDTLTCSESMQSDADTQSKPLSMFLAPKPEPEKTNTSTGSDNNASCSNQSALNLPIGKLADIERVSPSSGYNSPIRRWLIQESIKEIRLEKVPFANSLHCIRCHISASSNRGFLLHIFACHSIDVCKLCFFDLSKMSVKRVKGHLSTHSEYNRKLPVEDFLTLSCPEFMQLLGIPSLDQLCNITRDRIIFTFRVVWYRMAQVLFENDRKNIMQKNLTVNSSPKAGTPDIILFFRNKHDKIIQVDNENDSEVTKDASFRPEGCQFSYIAGQQTSKPIEAPAPASEAAEVNDQKCLSTISDMELETTRQFVEGKDFTIVLQGNDRVFKCLKCTRAYWNKCKMRRHLKVHLNIRNYQCHLCQKSFHYNYHLKAHMNIHNNSRPYKCSKCSKSYNNSGSLSWHVRQCHGHSNLSKNKVAKAQCKVCFIQVRQELYHEHLRERHGVAVAYQYLKSNADNKVPEGEDTEVEIEKSIDEQDTDDDTSQDEFPWRGELIVDEGDGDEEPDSYDLAPATAQNVFTVDHEKDTASPERYERQEVFQCTFCNTVYSDLPAFSIHLCPERHLKTNSKPSVSKRSQQNYTETYTCSNCKRTSLLLETFVESSHPCTLNSVSNFMCEKTYTCKLCQLIFTNLERVQKHECENADKQVEDESEEEQEPEGETPLMETVPDLSADLTCPVCNGVFSMTHMPFHLSSKHHLNRKVVFELMHQTNPLITK